LEAVEKPGNLGAILRTADAASVDAVIICDPLTDIYNPNAIRSSIGCVFTNQIVSTSSDKAIEWLKNNNIRAYAAALTARKNYHETDLTGSTAIVMGTEANGLTQKWLNQTDVQIIIPMCGDIDSLNVSTSTAILIFEAMRQRNFYK
jgi:TrmH family RNA methyltransferase